jgi:endonuclease-8
VLITFGLIGEWSAWTVVSDKELPISSLFIVDKGGDMPEGPSIRILRDETQFLVGKTIQSAQGNTKLDLSRLQGAKILSIRSWGKQLIIQLPDFAVRIHLLMFGSYKINERKETSPRLSLGFADKDELNFYACSVKFLEGDAQALYDWSADVMSDTWNAAAARKKLREQKQLLACDALLNQDIFAGVGNIIKNEVLFRIKVHPLSLVNALPAARLRALVEQARVYSFEFLEWKKAYVLRKHWLVHNRKDCPRCKIPLVKAYLGKTQRRSFLCERCQKLYGE